jgi:hypothetical protein
MLLLLGVGIVVGVPASLGLARLRVPHGELAARDQRHAHPPEEAGPGSAPSTVSGLPCVDSMPPAMPVELRAALNCAGECTKTISSSLSTGRERSAHARAEREDDDSGQKRRAGQKPQYDRISDMVYVSRRTTRHRATTARL